MSANVNEFDAIVLGAGAMGSAAAYYLAQAKQRVLLLEQFELDHQKGSSYGLSRVIRYSYDNPIYVNLMRDAYPLWFALQEAAGEQLYFKTGGIDFGLPSEPTMQNLKVSLKQTDLPHDRLSTHEAEKLFPQFRFDEGMEIIYQEDTGFLAASRCVLAHIRLAQANGATVLDQTPVNRIEVKGDRVEVQTARGNYGCDRLIITAGSWAKRILAEQGIDLPLRVMPCQLAFFEPDNPTDYEPGRFPVFIAHLNADYGETPYGIPTYQGSGVKITPFYGWDTVSDPSEVDYTPDLEWIERLREFPRRYLPGANGKLVSTRRCLYTVTPDKHFVIDRHPHYPQIVIGAGFSGHGFKFSTLVGKILMELAIAGKTTHDISLFNLSRF